MQRDTSPAPSFCGDKPEDTTHNLLEEVSLQMGASPNAPFRFRQSSKFPFTHCLSAEERWACSMTPDNQMHYGLHVILTLRDRTCSQPLPSHAWSGLLISDMFQDGLKEKNNWSCGPGTRGSNLVLWKMIAQRRTPLNKCEGHWIQLDRSS